jgi:septal ring-binding cell division protein DamX
MKPPAEAAVQPPVKPPGEAVAQPPAEPPVKPPAPSVPERTAEAPPGVARQEVPGGTRFAETQKIVDAGQIDVAAAAFRRLVTEERPDRFTLQLLIACDPETIRHARAATAKDSPLFVVPFAMQGRSCYRACWGMYRAKAEAQAAVVTLPPYFSTAGVAPVIVSFGRLVPPS